MNHNHTGYRDIHRHVPPGLDDGSKSISQYVETVKKYLEIGSNCIIATLHYIQGTSRKSSIEQVYSAIRRAEKTLCQLGRAKYHSYGKFGYGTQE
jgi:tyrosine-protein phosphatase YwqE